MVSLHMQRKTLEGADVLGRPPLSSCACKYMKILVGVHNLV